MNKGLKPRQIGLNEASEHILLALEEEFPEWSASAIIRFAIELYVKYETPDIRINTSESTKLITARLTDDFWNWIEQWATESGSKRQEFIIKSIYYLYTRVQLARTHEVSGIIAGQIGNFKVGERIWDKLKYSSHEARMLLSQLQPYKQIDLNLLRHVHTTLELINLITEG